MTERGVVGRALVASEMRCISNRNQEEKGNRSKAGERHCTTYTLSQFYNDAHDHPPRARNFGQEHEMAHQKLKQVLSLMSAMQLVG